MEPRLAVWMLVLALPMLAVGSRSPAGALLEVGYGIVDVQPGQSVAAAALFRLERSGVLVSEASVAAVEPISAGRIFVDRAGPRTGLALANPHPEPVLIDLTLSDADGLPIGRTRITLGAGEHSARFVRREGGFFPGLADGFEGTMGFSVVTPDRPAAAVTIRQSANSRGEPLFATLPVISQDSAQPGPAGNEDVPLVFPHIGAGAGLSTQLLLFNPHAEAISGEIRLTASDGSPLPLENEGAEASVFDYRLPAGGSLRMNFTSSRGIRQGYAALNEQEGRLPAGTAVFRFLSPDGQPISEAGVARGPVTRRSRIFVDAVDTRTDVALANLDNPAQTVRFALLDRYGALLDSAERQIPERGHFAVFADELFPEIPATFTGQIQIEADAPIVPVSLKLSTNLLGDPILTTLPVVDQDHPIAADRQLLPQIGFGQGFGTRVITLNPFAETAEVELSLRNSLGQPLEAEFGSGRSSGLELTLEPGHSAQLRPGQQLNVTQVFADAYNPLLDELPVVSGSQRRLTPVAVDAGGGVRDDVRFTFSSLDGTVAQVDDEGTISGIESGFSTLTIESEGVVSVTTASVVDVAPGAAAFAVTGVAGDLAGRLYLVDSERHAVFRSENLGEAPALWAGNPSESGLRDAARLEALFSRPAFTVLNQADGTLLISDTANHVIRRIRPGPSGEVFTVAGSGVEGHRDGALTEARFSRPRGIVQDLSGRLWVADQGSHVIRRIDLEEGRVETVAGSPYQSGERDGVGGSARFDSPIGLALEVEPVAEQLRRQILGEPRPPVSVLVADSGNGRIRRVLEDGTVQTVASAPPTARAQRLLSPLAAPLSEPAGIAADSFGRIYVSEPERGRVRVILPDGVPAPITANGILDRPQGLAVTSDGTLAVAVADRAVQQISFGEPSFNRDEIENEVGSDGLNRVTVTGRNFASDTVVSLTTGTVEDLEILNTQTLRFRAEPPPDVGQFGESTFLSVFNRGGLQTTLTRIGPNGTVGGVSFNNGMWDLTDLALDGRGDLLVLTGFALYELSQSGRLLIPLSGRDTIENGPLRQTRVTGSLGVSRSLGRILIAQSESHRIRQVDERGRISTLAGVGEPGFGGDGGPATDALLDSPTRATAGEDGTVFVADTGNHRIRCVNPESGVIETLAGSGAAGFGGDGGPAVDALLSAPADLGLGPDGALYVADTGNHRIRRIDLVTGEISTTAGNGSDEFSGSGGPATEAGIPSPSGIDLTLDGGLYIVTADRVVRADLQTGLLETVAGTGQEDILDPPPGTPATEFGFSGAGRVRVDAAGNLYVAETRPYGKIFRVDAISGIIERLPFNPLDVPF